MTDVLGGVVGEEPVDVQAAVEAGVERAVATTKHEPVVELGEADQDEREEGSAVPLVVEQDVEMIEGVLMEEMGLVEERLLGRGQPEVLILVAHSSGASTALFFAARYPGLGRAVAIVEPPVASRLTDASEDQQALVRLMAEIGKALGALEKGEDMAAVRLFADAVGGPGTYDRRTAEQKAMMLDNIAARVADATSKQPRPSFSCAMAQKVEAPVLLVSGTRSPAFFHRIAERLSDCLPNERRATIVSSHTVPGENPTALQEAVMRLFSNGREAR